MGGPGRVADAKSLNIAFIGDLTGPMASYWGPAKTAFQTTLQSDPNGEYIRLISSDSAGMASTALQNALRSVAVDQSRILVLGNSSRAARAVVGKLANERVIVISLANFEDAELVELRERSKGGFFALSGLTRSHIDMVDRLMNLRIFDRKEIALYGDDDLVQSLQRRGRTLLGAEVLDQRKVFFVFSKGDQPWNFIVAVSRFGTEFSGFLQMAERLGRYDRRFLGLSGPPAEFRGRVVARLLLSVVRELHPDAKQLDDAANLAKQLERSDLVDPATGSIVIPWDVMAYGLQRESYLIKEMLLYGRGRGSGSVELCQSDEDSFVFRLTACFRD